jgi:hypothetical protein
MNKQELIEAVIELPVDCSGSRPKVDKLTTLELIKLLDEPQKVVVPQFVAEWIDYFKKYSGFLYGSIAPYSYYGHAITDDFVGDVKKTLGWIRNNSETYARAWLDGYEVEKEPKYTVKIKATKHYFAKDGNGRIYFSLKYESAFTKIELEKVNLGWVFDCEGIEVKEVEE